MNHFQLLCQILTSTYQEISLIPHFQNFSDEDWPILLTQSRIHLVAPILYHRLKPIKNQVAVPEPILNQLRQDYLLNAARNTFFAHAAEGICSNLNKAGIPNIFLKGLYLSENIYPNPALRSMSDLDILLQKTDIPGGIAVLEGLGYRSSTYFNFTDENRDIKHVPPFIKDHGPFVELHWTLLEEDEPFTIDVTGLWERALPAKINQLDTLTLSLEDLFIHLSIHFTYQHHLGTGLRGLYDLAFVLNRTENSLDWEKLVKRSKTWGCPRVISLTLHLLEEFLCVQIPGNVYSELTDQPIPQEIISQARGQLMKTETVGVYLTPDLASLSEDASAFEKLRIIFQRIALPKRTMARLYDVDPHSLKIYFYYPLRFYQLLRSYWKSTLRILRGEEQAVESASKVESKLALKDWLKG